MQKFFLTERGILEKAFLILCTLGIYNLSVDWPYKETPFQILGIEKSATNDDIKTAYKQLALQFHPDKIKVKVDQDFSGTDITKNPYKSQYEEALREALEYANEAIRKINNARDLLLDTQKRQRYESGFESFDFLKKYENNPDTPRERAEKEAKQRAYEAKKREWEEESAQQQIVWKLKEQFENTVHEHTKADLQNNTVREKLLESYKNILHQLTSLKVTKKVQDQEHYIFLKDTLPGFISLLQNKYDSDVMKHLVEAKYALENAAYKDFEYEKNLIYMGWWIRNFFYLTYLSNDIYFWSQVNLRDELIEKYIMLAEQFARIGYKKTAAEALWDASNLIPKWGKNFPVDADVLNKLNKMINPPQNVFDMKKELQRFNNDLGNLARYMA